MDSQNKNPLLSLGTISPTIALILLALGPIFRSGGIVSSRPTIDPMQAPMVPGEVPARLWEDPFQAVLNYVEAWKQSDPADASEVLSGKKVTLPANWVKRDRIDPVRVLQQFPRVGNANDREARVTFVLLAGASGHRENGERMTTRTAVGQGILAHGGTIQSGKLPFLTFPKGDYFKSDFPHFAASGRIEPGSAGDKFLSLKSPLFLPYDRFRVDRSKGLGVEHDDESIRDKSPYDHLVFYVDIDRLGSDWLGKLSYLHKGFEYAIQGDRPSESSDPLKLKFSCIGPGFSDHLIQALDTVPDEQLGARYSPEQLQDLPLIYSPFATMDAGAMYIALGMPVPESPETQLIQDLSTLGWRLARTTSTDSKLRLLLLRELKLRFPFTADHLHAVIMAESDSAYGTSWLPEENGEHVDPSNEEESELDLLWPDILETHGDGYDLAKVHVKGGIRYWRGLDGTGLWQGGAGAGAIKDSENLAEAGYPAGASQVDYLNRYIAEQKASYSNFAESKLELDLVGIFGVDPYDGLMLLRGAKESFPHAMYFGADLDARYFHQKDLPVTRNMLFVAHYGLVLPNGLQKNLPPFRDSYQTATYFATLEMLNDAGCLSQAESNELAGYSRQPRLFEIGNGRAIELSLPKVRADAESHQLLLKPPVPSKVKMLLLLIGFLTGLGFLDQFVLGGKLGQRWKEQNRNGRWTKWVWLYVGGAAALIWVSISWSVAGGEPLSMTNGISAWPTQFVRYFCLGLTAWMVLDIRHRFAACRRGIAKVWPIRLQGHWDQKYMQTTPLSLAWDELEQRHNWKRERNECLRGTLLLGVIFFLLVQFFGWAGNQTRGLGMEVLNYSLALASNVAFAFLFCLTLRYFQSFNSLIHRLVTNRLPEDTYPLDRFNYEKVLNYYRFELKVVTRVADRVYAFIYYPAVILLLLGLARSTYFDAWVWPMSLIIALPVVFCALLLAGILIRREAARFRRQRLIAYAELERQFGNSELPAFHRPDLATLCRETAEELQSLDRGVFASILNDPIVKAMLVPLSGFGALAMLEEGITFM